MKAQKMSLKGMKAELTRKEMKNIMAGSSGNPCPQNNIGFWYCELSPGYCYTLGQMTCDDAEALCLGGKPTSNPLCPN